MEQTRLASMVEAAFNTAAGYGVALAGQLVIFPLFGIHIPFSDNLAISALFTVLSLLRGYLVRRFFNARLRGAHAVAERMASLGRGQLDFAREEYLRQAPRQAIPHPEETATKP